MDSILIRAPNWIGDCIISLPVVKEIRRLYPDARLAILARAWVSDIYRAGAAADEVISIDPNDDDRTGGMLRLCRNLSRRNFDCTLLLPNAFRSAVIAWLSRIPLRIGYNTDHRGFLLTCSLPVRREALTLHQSFYYLDLLTQSGLSPVQYIGNGCYKPDVRLRLGGEDTKQAVDILERLGVSLLRPVIGINPGAFYGPAKRWFPERYAAVADYLVTRWNAQILILGSAGESKIAREIQVSMKHAPVILTGSTTLRELMGLIEHCDLFISNDSGPMHLAAALQRPLIALFGSTDERATGPLTPGAYVIHKQVECTPCFLRTCPIDLRCFKKIEVQEVCKLADDILQAEGGGH
ncbi:MAG TPA: lipopolysaccharide heptosyltransferase II [Acidobacteriota bacterium]|jgi:heptosyltransferase-2